MARQKKGKGLCYFFTSSHVLVDALLYFLSCIAYNYVPTQMPFCLIYARKPGCTLSPWWPRRQQGVAASVINWLKVACYFAPSSNGRTMNIRISTPPLFCFCTIIQCPSVSLVVQWFGTIWSNLYLSLYLYLTLDFDLYHSKHFLLNI
jgi:hypothetical protein